MISTFVSFRNITESVEDFPASRDRKKFDIGF